MITTRYGTKIQIIKVLPSFKSNGREFQRVLTENIDERSVTWGLQRDMNVEDLVETSSGEIQREIEKVKNV